MRKAEFDKAWLDCRGKKKTLDIREVVTRIGNTDHVVRLMSRVLAIVGSNGAGKTSWLKQIAGLERGQKATSSKDIEVLRVSGFYRGGLLSLPSENSPWAQTTMPAVDYVDVAGEVHRCLNYVKSIQNLSEMLPQVGAKTLTQTELSHYQYSVQSNYTEIKIFELELPALTETYFPYFEVKIKGNSYTSLSMGFGEMCAFYIVWRCSRAEKGSVLLLDEPDSHLSPRCKVATINFFAMISAERLLFIFFSSHAAETVLTLQKDEVLLIADNGAPSIYFSPEKHISMRRLGLLTKPNILVIVEDVDAHELLLQVWSKWAGELNSAIEIQIMLGGATELVRLQKLFPAGARICSLQVILDGDKREEHDGSSKALFLPGIDDPVASARVAVVNYPEHFADQIGISAGHVLMAVGELAYADHHDFCHLLAERLNVQGVDTKRVRSCLFRTWLFDDKNQTDAHLLALQLVQLVKAN